MPKTVCIINGHPDPAKGRFVEALADAYAAGAGDGDHTVSRIDIAKLPIEFLRTAAEFALPPSEPIANERAKILAADHLVLIYPLWMGSMPAIDKAFLEQIGRGDFLIDVEGPQNDWPAGRMKGRSARVIVTMGMPGIAYSWLFGAHSLKALELGILKMAGFGPIRHNILGAVEAVGAAGRARMIARVKALGQLAR